MSHASAFGAVPRPVAQKPQLYQPARRTYSCRLVRKLITPLPFDNYPTAEVRTGTPQKHSQQLTRISVHSTWVSGGAHTCRSNALGCRRPTRNEARISLGRIQHLKVLHIYVYIYTRIKRALRARRALRNYIMELYYGTILRNHITGIILRNYITG